MTDDRGSAVLISVMQRLQSRREAPAVSVSDIQNKHAPATQRPTERVHGHKRAITVRSEADA
jgi:hypothetical protein